MLIQFQMVEELLQFCDRQIHQFGNILSAYAYIAGFRFQTGTVAFRAKCFSAIPGKHHTILYLILIFFKHLEEVINTVEILVSFPKQPALFVRQFIIRSENREVEFLRIVDQLFFPFSHFFTAPTYDRSFINR